MPATTSSGSPPSTADIPVGASAHAAAISAPRRAAKATASSGFSAPATAAAVSSPTLCPATTTSRVVPPQPELRGPRSRPSDDDQRLGDRGVLDLVGVGGRAQARQVEPGELAVRTRVSSTPGSSSQGGEHARRLGALPGREYGDHAYQAPGRWAASEHDAYSVIGQTL